MTHLRPAERPMAGTREGPAVCPPAPRIALSNAVSLAADP